MILLVGIVCVLFNLFGANKLPLFEGIVLCLYVIGFFAIGIPLWVLAPKVPAKEVFFDFSNYGGWSSTAAAVIIGQSSAATALIVRHHFEQVEFLWLTQGHRALTAQRTCLKKCDQLLKQFRV